jgi:hypothetical protein
MHPLNAMERVSGRTLQPGEVLQEDDVYDSTTGKWEPVPNAFVGNIVGEKHGAMLIRPEKQDKTTSKKAGAITVGPHQNVEKLSRKDINGRHMVMCWDCSTSAHAFDEAEAVADLSKVSCSPDCVNCNSLNHSCTSKPAVPFGGTCNDRLHVCPNDGNRWWQTNGHFHLWQQVTSDREWEAIRNPRNGQYDIDHFD